MRVHQRMALLVAATALVGGTTAIAAPTAVAASGAPAAVAASSCTYGSIGWYCGHYFSAPQSSPMLSYGSTGAAVREVQDLIASTTAYYAYHDQALAVDGDFGPRTRDAVRWFQRTYMGAAEADGIVGPKTWRELRA
ncbi:peptidoglycan-binding domain-containing protein [Streptomyces sp. MH13]|uniref:peptidoglycan-binding domain-containing protein n=1 Tax=unclassified Streptomyces TaxID=2593676 RepID=UPI003CE92F68